MDFSVGSVLVGLLLILLALSGTVLARLPLSTAMLYLGVGMAVSPLGLGLMTVNPRAHSVLLERVTEVIIMVSLFGAGLKLSPGLRDRRWLLPLRLALVSMVITVAAIAALAYRVIGLPLGAAVLLGGILAPTDPVLASDVQVQKPSDRDRLRFSLTGEGGLNDGTAFPFVLLGLGLLGAPGAAPPSWHWLLVEGIWATLCGLAVGALLGLAIGRLVLYLRRQHQEALGLDDFLALGLIALSYGAAQLLHANGFLAVFAAGVSLRRLQQTMTKGPDSQRAVEVANVHPDASVAEAVAVHPRHAPAYMAQALLGFNEQVERIGELAIVITIGALLWAVQWPQAVWWLVPVLLLVIRPLAVTLGLLGSASSGGQRWLIGWFGIRGIGSLYYLSYAVNRGVPEPLAGQLAAVTLSVIVTSIVVHGVSVTPLMAAYEKAARRRRPSVPP